MVSYKRIQRWAVCRRERSRWFHAELSLHSAHWGVPRRPGLSCVPPSLTWCQTWGGWGGGGERHIVTLSLEVCGRAHQHQWDGRDAICFCNNMERLIVRRSLRPQSLSFVWLNAISFFPDFHPRPMRKTCRSRPIFRATSAVCGKQDKFTNTWDSSPPFNFNICAETALTVNKTREQGKTALHPLLRLYFKPNVIRANVSKGRMDQPSFNVGQQIRANKG